MDFDIFRQKEKARMEAAKAAICAAFKDMPHIGRVEIQYQGSGDSGNIEWVTAYGADSVKITDGLPDIDGPAWEIAYGAHPGFETNEGGGGTITVYPHVNRVIVSHYDYVVEEVFDADKEI